MPQDLNLTTDLSKASVTLGIAPGIPGTAVGGLSRGEYVRMDPVGDRVSVVQGLRGSTFKVTPIEGISYVLTITLQESAGQGTLLFMDALYKAGVPTGFVYKDGETNQAGVCMVLGDAPKAMSTDGTTRVYRFGCIDVQGPSGATATTGGGVEA